MKRQQLIRGILRKLLQSDLQQLISRMQWQHSPIRISNRINLPTVHTPSPIKPNFHSKSPSREQQIERARREVVSIKDRGDHLAALAMINELINIYPSDIRSYQIKGELTFSLKMYQEALQTYDQLLAITSIMQSVELTASPAKLDSGHTITQIKRMRSLYYFNRALCLQKLDQHTEAVSTFKKSIQLNKNRSETYTYLAESYRALKMDDKVKKVYSKLIETSPEKSEHLFKIIKICNSGQDFAGGLHFIDRGLQLWGRGQPSQQGADAVLIELLSLKGETLRKLQRYDEAIHASLQLLSYKPTDQKLIKIYNKLAWCYDFKGNFEKAAQYYSELLRLDSKSIETINNLANLYLRQGKYQEAYQLLTSDALPNPSQQTSQDFSVILLKCHRLIASVNLSRIEQAAQDLSQIMATVAQERLVQMQNSSQWQNYKFVRYTIDRYKHSLTQLNCLKQKQPEQHSQQVLALERELVRSISQEISKSAVAKQQGKQSGTAKQPGIAKQEGRGVDLQKLEQRIDRLYNQIVSFKKRTLEQHEQNTSKVHNRILQIQQLMAKREEDNAKLEKQLETMKLQHHHIYNLVQLARNSSGLQLTALIDRTKQQGNKDKAVYLQQFYWLFNAYLIAIRLIANQFIAPTHKHLHLSKVSSFFAKFKQTFRVLSHIPHIGSLCEVITATISLYLSEESSAIYRTLNSIITNNYYLQKDLHKALQQALVNLVESNYIEQAIGQLKSNLIPKEKSPFNRAYSWFKQKKNRAVEKMLKIETPLSHDERAIQELVVQDISAVFVYLLNNKKKYLIVTESNPETLKEAIQKTLILGFKKKEINQLYSEETCKEAEANRRGEACSQCTVYRAQILCGQPGYEIDHRVIMDELIGDAVRQNNTELFNYAVSRLHFNFG